MANPTATVNNPYFAQEVHSPFAIEHDTFDLTMSTSNDASGKAPIRAQAPPNVNGGGHRYGGTNIVSVEPPKQSDLQVRYQYTPLIFGPTDATNALCSHRLRT